MRRHGPVIVQCTDSVVFPKTVLRAPFLLHLKLSNVQKDVEFLANVNSSSLSLYVIGRPSVCSLSVVCRLSVTFVHPTQAIEIFGNIYTPYGTMAIC